MGEQLRYWRAKAARLVVERDGFLLGPGVAIDKPVGELSEQQRKGLFLHLLCHKMDSQVGQLFREDDVFYFVWKDVMDNNEKAAKGKPGSCFRYEPVTLKWAISLFIKLGKKEYEMVRQVLRLPSPTYIQSLVVDGARPEHGVKHRHLHQACKYLADVMMPGGRWPFRPTG